MGIIESHCCQNDNITIKCSIQIFLAGCIKSIFSARVHIGCSRSSKGIDFGNNQKCVCDLLLVVNSNLGLFFLVSEILQVCSSETEPTSPLLFHPNFGDVAVGPYRRCWGSMWACTLRYSAVKSFFPIYVIMIPERHRRAADRRLSVAIPRDAVTK